MYAIDDRQVNKESRWGTINTRLAACLIVYGYRLCKQSPFIRTFPANDPSKISVGIWFNDAHPAGVTSATAQDWEVAWRMWADLKAGAGYYVLPPDWREPLVIMRGALECREWFSKKVVGASFKNGVPVKPCYVTDLAEAMCLTARGLHIYQASPAGFVFDATKISSMRQDFLSDGKNCPMQWAKRVIYQYEDLRRAMQRPEIGPMMHMRVGNRVGLIPVDAPPSIREPLVRMLYV